MARKAVLIGINYPGTEGELTGCVNDVKSMHKVLLEMYGFLDNDITILIDTEPTGKNIRQALSELVDSAKSGDILFVHYSGHGVRVPPETGEEDDTGFDEFMVPSDSNYITEIVEKVPKDCSFTFISDSCHSGGLIDSAKEQIGNSTKNNIKNPINQESNVNVNVKNKFLTLQTSINMLKQKTGKSDIQVGNIRTTLFDVFGEDASPKVKKFMNVILTNLQDNNNGLMLRNIEKFATNFVTEKLNDLEYVKSAMETEVRSLKEVYGGRVNGEFVENGILLSGCQSDQTSADIGDGSKAYGAFSNSLQIILGETKGKISYKDLVLKSRKLIKGKGYEQEPGLYCSDCYLNAQFIC